ncbi:MAG: hypothetical protein RIS94_296 [Pseudomonadota bacterium]|jgi:capsular polysaccharide export protein
MTNLSAQGRTFLFLQGPPGPFFPILAKRIRALGGAVHRINICGGDRYDWRDEAIDYRGRMKRWPLWFDRFIRREGITDLVLYGDCRPMHQSALRMAQMRGIQVHVFEEGYIRPDWMTLERDGVNGHSRFNRDPDAIREAARQLPPIPHLPSITASFRRRARDSYWHYHHVVTGKLRFPFYRSHRPGSICVDGLGWAKRLLLRKRRARQADATLRAVTGKPFFLFPMQLTHDYQIRAHSPFDGMPMACDYVMESFALHAPADAHLLVKEHPLDSGWRNWRRFIESRARRLGLHGRIHHVDGGNLLDLSRQALGMVCVNSTSGTLAAAAGTPVIVLGDAVYDIAGITHQGGLDDFWTAPEKPDADLFDAFTRTLHAQCLVRGGLASESAITILVENSLGRLLA